MATPRVLDPEPLLRPIPGASPTGENLRADPSPTSPYYQIKDARNSARTAERAAQQAEEPAEAAAPDWRPVLELAPKLLAERSKDLEIAAWLIEAIARKQGFAGLRDGFQLVRRLVETFWDGLHPMPDEEGVTTRVAPLTGLNGDEAEGTLLVPIGMITLLHDGNGMPLSAWHYKTGREVGAILDPDARQRRIDAGAVTVERFQEAVRAADPVELFGTLDDVEECVKEYGLLVAALDQRCGGDSPPSSSIRQALQDVRDCMLFLTKDIPRPGAYEASAGGAQGQAGAPGAASGGRPGEIRTRKDALDAITRVRDFFRQTEPHSPISYLLDQSVRWAQTPLHVLVAELIPDPEALTAFQLRTGVPASSPPASPT